MPVLAGASAFEQLTRRHAIKLTPTVSCSVEEASLAVGKAVGYEHIKSASRMNGAIIIFLSSTEKVAEVVESGVVILNTFTPVLPLVSPAKRVIISNAPPFIGNETIANELSRFGQLVSPIKMIPLGCKSPLLKHVVCHRRQVYMVLKDNTTELNVSFSFRIDGFTYMIFATSETMKCFACGGEGHLIRDCPRKANNNPPETTISSAETPSASPDFPEGDPVADVEPPVPTAGTVPATIAISPGHNAESRCLNAVPSMSPSNTPLPRLSKVVLNNRKAGELNDHDKVIASCGEQVASKPTHRQTQSQPAVSDNSTCSIFEEICEDEEMWEEDLLKMSQKKKSSETPENNEKVSKVTKMKGATSTESEGVPISQDLSQPAYSTAEIKKFLQETKGARNVKIENWFPDLKLFLESARVILKSSGGNGEDDLTEQEVYRLKKVLIRVKNAGI